MLSYIFFANNIKFTILQKQHILPFEKLEPSNVLHFCLNPYIND